MKALVRWGQIADHQDLVENHLTNDESAGRANEHVSTKRTKRPMCNLLIFQPSYDYPIDVKWTREGVEEILAAVGLQCSPLLQVGTLVRIVMTCD